MKAVIHGIVTTAAAGFVLVGCVLINSIGAFISTDVHVVSGENSKIGSFWSVLFLRISTPYL